MKHTLPFSLLICAIVFGLTSCTSPQNDTVNAPEVQKIEVNEEFVAFAEQFPAVNYPYQIGSEDLHDVHAFPEDHVLEKGQDEFSNLLYAEVLENGNTLSPQARVLEERENIFLLLQEVGADYKKIYLHAFDMSGKQLNKVELASANAEGSFEIGELMASGCFTSIAEEVSLHEEAEGGVVESDDQSISRITEDGSLERVATCN